MGKAILAALIIGAVWYLFFSKPAKKPARRKPSEAAVREAEARAILGVGPDADAEAIRAAHRRLISALHPDKGGSAELTGRINAARDCLLRTRN
jgi:DnaJ homolog subfamily C member 19